MGLFKQIAASLVLCAGLCTAAYATTVDVPAMDGQALLPQAGLELAGCGDKDKDKGDGDFNPELLSCGKDGKDKGDGDFTTEELSCGKDGKDKGDGDGHFSAQPDSLLLACGKDGKDGGDGGDN
jgi:hypothetical protein